jgi:hypothetical protein
LELHRQAASLQETVEVRFADESDTELLLIFRTEDMKVKYVPERNAVRWEREMEYGLWLRVPFRSYSVAGGYYNQMAAAMMKRRPSLRNPRCVMLGI